VIVHCLGGKAAADLLCLVLLDLEIAYFANRSFPKKGNEAGAEDRLLAFDFRKLVVVLDVYFEPSPGKLPEALALVFFLAPVNINRLSFCQLVAQGGLVGPCAGAGIVRAPLR